MLPILFQSHNLILYSYPLLMGLGWGIAYQLFFSKADVKPLYGQILFWGIFLFAWIGSKLLFSLTSVTASDQSLLLSSSFWTGGGFVFYGGLIGGLVFILLYRAFRFPITFNTLWSMLPALTVGHAVGRIGCLLAGCCFGSETSWWWGIHLHGASRHPTQLLESLGLFILLTFILKAPRNMRTFSLYFLGYGLLRLGTEALRGDGIRGQWGVLTPSQWISLLMILGGVCLLKFKHLKSSQSL